MTAVELTCCECGDFWTTDLIVRDGVRLHERECRTCGSLELQAEEIVDARTFVKESHR